MIDAKMTKLNTVSAGLETASNAFGETSKNYIMWVKITRCLNLIDKLDQRNNHCAAVRGNLITQRQDANVPEDIWMFDRMVGV